MANRSSPGGLHQQRHDDAATPLSATLREKVAPLKQMFHENQLAEFDASFAELTASEREFAHSLQTWTGKLRDTALSLKQVQAENSEDLSTDIGFENFRRAAVALAAYGKQLKEIRSLLSGEVVAPPVNLDVSAQVSAPNEEEDDDSSSESDSDDDNANSDVRSDLVSNAINGQLTSDPASFSVATAATDHWLESVKPAFDAFGKNLHAILPGDDTSRMTTDYQLQKLEQLLRTFSAAQGEYLADNPAFVHLCESVQRFFHALFARVVASTSSQASFDNLIASVEVLVEALAACFSIPRAAIFVKQGEAIDAVPQGVVIVQFRLRSIVEDAQKSLPSLLARKTEQLMRIVRGDSKNSVGASPDIFCDGLPGTFVLLKDSVTWQGESFSMKRSVRVSTADLATDSNAIALSGTSLKIVTSTGRALRFENPSNNPNAVSLLQQAAKVLADKTSSAEKFFVPSPEDEFVSRCEVVTHQKGAILIKQGEPAINAALYRVLSGEVSILFRAETVATLGEGDVFGEITFLAAMVHDLKAVFSATVAALTECTLVRVRPQEFVQTCARPGGEVVRWTFHRYLAQQLSLKLGSASSRLAAISPHASHVHDAQQLELSGHHRIVDACPVLKYNKQKAGRLFFCRAHHDDDRPALYYANTSFGGMRQAGFIELENSADVKKIAAKKIDVKVGHEKVRIKFTTRENRDKYYELMVSLVHGSVQEVGLMHSHSKKEVSSTDSYAAMRPRDWDKLLQHCTKVIKYSQGDKIIERGTHPGALFHIVKGTANVLVGTKLLAQIGQDQMAGEISMLTGRAAMADIVVATPFAEIVRLDQETLDAVLQEDPDLASRFYANMALLVSQRLTMTNDATPFKQIPDTLIKAFTDPVLGLRLHDVFHIGTKHSHAFTLGELIAWLLEKDLARAPGAPSSVLPAGADEHLRSRIPALIHEHVIYPLFEGNFADMYKDSSHWGVPFTLGEIAFRTQRNARFFVEYAPIVELKKLVWQDIALVITSTHIELTRKESGTDSATKRGAFLFQRIPLQSVTSVSSGLCPLGQDKKIDAVMKATPLTILHICTRTNENSDFFIKCHSYEMHLEIALALAALDPTQTPLSCVAAVEGTSPFRRVFMENSIDTDDPNRSSRIKKAGMWSRDNLESIPYDGTIYLRGRSRDVTPYKSHLLKITSWTFVRTATGTEQPAVILASNGLVPLSDGRYGLIGGAYTPQDMFYFEIPMRAALHPVLICHIIGHSLLLNPETPHVKSWTEVCPESNDLISYEDRARQQTTFKFGVVPVYSGQTQENDFYSNSASPGFTRFMNLIGERTTLKGFTGYRGGLDVTSDSTGTETYVAKHEGYPIMFHCVPLLPSHVNDAQRLERKRHVGNDIVVIIYRETGDPFDPTKMVNQFNHVIIVCTPIPGKESFQVAVTTKLGVESYGPPTPSVEVPASQLRSFVLTKAINGERTALASPEFRHKIEGARRMMLENILTKPGCAPALSAAQAVLARSGNLSSLSSRLLKSVNS